MNQKHLQYQNARILELEVKVEQMGNQLRHLAQALRLQQSVLKTITRRSDWPVEESEDELERRRRLRK